MTKEEFIKRFECLDENGNPEYVEIDRGIWKYLYIQGLTPTHIDVYIYLKGEVDPKLGYANPSYVDMMLDLNLTEPTISKAIEMLERVNLIKVERFSGSHRNHYYVLNPLPWDEFAKQFPKAAESYFRKVQQ